MKNRQNLPIGKSSFEVIRHDNDLYVDKTRHIYAMVDSGSYYFLSRPRRFGKSLTISTLRCLFQGRKELFKGLWLYENAAWEWKAHYNGYRFSENDTRVYNPFSVLSNQSATASIRQIREKGYADPYRGSGKQIILMGIAFDTEKRNVAEWLIES